MSAIVKEFVFYRQHVRQNGVAGTKLGQRVAVHSVKELVLSPIKVTWLVGHVKPDVSASQDMFETKQDIVSHGVSVHHKIRVVKMNIIHTVEVRAKNQNVHVFNHMDIIAMLKGIIFEIFVSCNIVTSLST